MTECNLPEFGQVSVLVVGDVMLDRYWHGATSRISPEAPVPIVRVEEMEDRPGGAANVALNLAALGVRTILIGLTGDDEAADTLQKHLSAAGVECRFERVPDIPTVTKLRATSRRQQLIRLDFEESFPLHASAAVSRLVADAVNEVDFVICSDYAKGCLAEISEIITDARSAGRRVLVDPKSADFAKYSGASIITPNFAEFETVLGTFLDESEMVKRGTSLANELDLEALLVTRGEHGMTLIQPGKPECHLPAQAREVYDVTGAGDTVIAVFGAALAAGEPLNHAAGLAKMAAGCVVAKLGTAIVTPAELRRSLIEEQAVGKGVMSTDKLMLAVEDSRSRNERIVLTNGCFDILHSGHVEYLAEARRLGDRLIVAVNNDDSVRRLKGKGRPMNGLDRRMAVLAALEPVDWVVAFSEDTPAELIERLKPDVLVKGGDYNPQDITGSDSVIEAGGEVKILGYQDGVSTTELMMRIRGEAN